MKSGLVERAEDPDDRRARQIALTAKGRSLVARGIEERYRFVDELVASLTGRERDAVRTALPTLLKAEERLAGADRRHMR